MVTKKAKAAKAKAARAKRAKLAKARLVKVIKVSEDKHVLALEAEVEGKVPEELLPLISSEEPLDLTPDAPEPARRTLWEWLFG